MILDTLLVPLAAGLAVAGIAYFFVRLYTVRRAFRHLPGPPHDFLWGHLKLFGTYISKFPADTYIHGAFTQIKQDHDLPDLFYLDLWPFGPRFVVCSGPDAAAVPTTVTPFPQSTAVTNFFAAARIGARFIEATNGAVWKELHLMLAPGLTPAAVRTYHGVLADEARGLQEHIRAVAEREGGTADLSAELGRLPFGVITRIFFGGKMDDEAIRANFKDAAALAGRMVSENKPWLKWQVSQGVKRNLAAIDEVLVARIRSRYEVLQGEKVLPTRATATNFLDRMLVGQVQSGRGLDERLMAMVLDNAKGFLVAGWGTTTDTLCYLFILLSVFPDALRKLREEHDRVFDKDSSTTFQMLLEKPSLLNELKYTQAVINETLRLFPIGMVVRDPPAGQKTFEFKGKQYPCEDHLVMVCANAMHYDASIFPEPSEFRPERFLTNDENAFPRNAFRPFERGLRSCMGQQLAMEEMSMALLMLARWFDFELRDHDPSATPRLGYTKLDTKLGIHAFQTPGFSAGPHGAVSMGFRVAKRA
ncbi:putative sterigmatocystin biosynthesis P450 monooxygenase stcS [Podospora conica]|nr:putative sterigmatocystin biosynthesis P450 monooxygenase stcS [Schizothecium conicum]